MLSRRVRWLAGALTAALTLAPVSLTPASAAPGAGPVPGDTSPGEGYTYRATPSAAGKNAFVAPGEQATPARSQARNVRPLVAREGSVSDPDTVTPPARDIRAARFRIEYATGKATATVTLGAAPTAATTSDLWVMFGQRTSTTCEVSAADAFKVPTEEAGGGTNTAVVHIQYGRGWQNLDCALALTMPTGSTEPGPSRYDQAGTDLKDILAPSVGRLQAALHPADDTVYTRTRNRVRVVVRNPGTGPVTGIRIAVRGGVVSRKASTVRRLAAGKRVVVRVPVWVRGGNRLKGGPKTRPLRVIVTGKGPAAVRQQSRHRVMVLPRAPRPTPGRYVGSKPRGVSFTVTPKRVIKGFKVRFTGGCYGGSNFRETMRLPATRINKHGWADRTYRIKDGAITYTAVLRVRFQGNRATHGFYSYNSGLCRGTAAFKASRVRR